MTNQGIEAFGPTGGGAALGIVQSYTLAGLPPSGTVGTLARVSNAMRGLWMDQGNQWFALSGGIYNVREFGAVGDGVANDTTPIQTAIDAAEAAGGGIVFFPAGTYKTTAALTVQASGVYLVGASRSASIISITGSVDGLVFGVDDANQINNRATGLKIQGGRYPLRLNNIQQSSFEDLWLQTHTSGIYQEGQVESCRFILMDILGSTSYGIITGQVNGGVDSNYNYPSIQKCLFENIILAGYGAKAINLSAGNDGVQRNNNKITFRHVLSQGSETGFITTDHTYNLTLDQCHNEIQGNITANTHSGFVFSTGTGLVTMRQCSIAAKANGTGTMKYGIEQNDGFLFIRDCEILGGVPAGTADIYIAGVGANIEHCSVMGGASTGIVFANTVARRMSLLCDIWDGATNLQVTGWPDGTPFIGPYGTDPKGLVTGNIQIASATGKIGFYGTAPIVQAVLPTGSTADQIITALQNLGLVRQA